MTMNIPPPAYTSADARPPSYSNASEQAPLPDPDVKQPILEERERASTPQLQATPREQGNQALATVTSSLQPFSKLRHPSATPIPEASWNAFVADLRNSVAPTSGEKALAILAGAGVGLGSWPVFGIIVGGLIWKKAVEKRVRGSMEGYEAEGSSPPASKEASKPADGREPIGQVVDRYNQMWAPLGVCVRLEGISKAEAHAQMTCQCLAPATALRGSLGRRASAGYGARCESCGMSRAKKCGKMRQELRRDIVKVVVEPIGTPREMTRMDTTAVSEPQEAEKETWVDEKGH